MVNGELKKKSYLNCICLLAFNFSLCMSYMYIYAILIYFIIDGRNLKTVSDQVTVTIHIHFSNTA